MSSQAANCNYIKTTRATGPSGVNHIECSKKMGYEKAGGILVNSETGCHDPNVGGVAFIDYIVLFQVNLISNWLILGKSSELSGLKRDKSIH